MYDLPSTHLTDKYLLSCYVEIYLLYSNRMELSWPQARRKTHIH